MTSRHLQPISRKDKRRLVTDIVIQNYLPARVNVSVFSAKKGQAIQEIAEIIEKNFESKIREYAGPLTVNRE